METGKPRVKLKQCELQERGDLLFMRQNLIWYKNFAFNIQYSVFSVHYSNRLFARVRPYFFNQFFLVSGQVAIVLVNNFPVFNNKGVRHIGNV